MNALPAIDHLSDAKIAGDAHQRIGVIAAEILMVGQQRQHIDRGFAHRHIEIFVEAVNDPFRRRLQQWRRKVEILAYKNLEQHVQRRLDGGTAQLAVTLRDVRVTD